MLSLRFMFCGNVEIKIKGSRRHPQASRVRIWRAGANLSLTKKLFGKKLIKHYLRHKVTPGIRTWPLLWTKNSMKTKTYVWTYFCWSFSIENEGGCAAFDKRRTDLGSPKTLAQSTKQSPNLTLVSGKVQRKVGKGGPVRVQTEKWKCWDEAPLPDQDLHC